MVFRKMLLFLGCSLNIDRTMELLQRIIKLNSGVTHYAIIEYDGKKILPNVLRNYVNKWEFE